VVPGVHLSCPLEADALKSPPMALVHGDPIWRTGRGQRTGAIRSRPAANNRDGNQCLSPSRSPTVVVPEKIATALKVAASRLLE
jgi:hypothetical protein